MIQPEYLHDSRYEPEPDGWERSYCETCKQITLMDIYLHPDPDKGYWECTECGTRFP